MSSTTFNYGQAVAREKERMRESISNARETFKERKRKLKRAKAVGYRSGDRDYPYLPKTKGAGKKATKGYSNAIKDNQKIDSMVAKRNKKAGRSSR